MTEQLFGWTIPSKHNNIVCEMMTSAGHLGKTLLS